MPEYKNSEFVSPAEESAAKILQAVQIIQKVNPKVSLIGLDKAVLVGPGPSPDSKGMTPEIVDQLDELDFEWDDQQGSWSFYTGHG